MVGKPGNPKCGNRHDNIDLMLIISMKTEKLDPYRLKNDK